MVRTLRIAAAVVAIAAVAAIVLPHLWWWMEGSEQAERYDAYYLVFDVANAIGVVISAGAAVLILLALAHILDRLDDIQGRIGPDG